MSILYSDVATGNSGKANFDDMYRAADPREYYRVLCGFDYVIPDLGKHTFRSLIGLRAALQSEPVKVLDIGCSYGINSALIQYPLDIKRLTQRYTCPHMYGVSSGQMKNFDKNYFASWPKHCNAEFYGVDISKPATSYAKSVGLITDAVNTNLEASRPKEAERTMLHGVDVIISTGCVGYVSHRTFAQVMQCQADAQKAPPVVAVFVLRMYSYDAIAAELARHGLITEKLEGITFVQRRFHSLQEFDVTIKRLNAMGISPNGKESDGLLHAELFISRTEEAIRKTPINELISVTSGVDRRYGRRYRHVNGNEPKLMR